MERLRNALSLHITAHGKKHKHKREEDKLQVGEFQKSNIIVGDRRGFRVGKMKQFKGIFLRCV